MNAWNRVFGTLLAAAAVGFLLWVAVTQFNLHNTGGYWAAMGVVAACGLLLGLAQLRGAGGNPPAMALFAFLPVFICSSWVLLYAQPHDVWGRSQITRWSGDIGVRSFVHHISMWNGILAFGIGLVFAYTVEPGMLRRRRTVVATEPAPAPMMDEPVADEPTQAEREEAAAGSETRTHRFSRTKTTVR
jgi:hypothetical protein